MFGNGRDKRRATGGAAKRLVFESLEQRVVLSSASLASAPAATEDPYVIEPPGPLSHIAPGDVPTLPYWRFKELEPEVIPYVTLVQMAGLPLSYLAEMRVDSRAAFNQPQIQAIGMPVMELESGGVSYYTSTQLGWLTTAQINRVPWYNFPKLSTAQIPALLPAQIATIPTAGAMNAWSAAARAALTQPQMQALSMDPMVLTNLYTPEQVGWLTATQVVRVPYFDFPLLSPAQIPLLTPEQIRTIPTAGAMNAWSPAARAALTQPQMQALSMDPMVLTGLYTSQQISWLTAAQVARVPYYDFHSLAPAQVPHLTPQQIGSIPSQTYFNQWSSAARAALTPIQVQSLVVDANHVRIFQLTTRQLHWLTRQQIQSVRLDDFQFLPPDLVKSLSTQQIAQIPSASYLVQWSPAVRAALTEPQVRALNLALNVTVQGTGITQLTDKQRSWLTQQQVRAAVDWEFPLLSARHVPWLTAAQLRSIPTAGSLAAWSPQARAALTALQIPELVIPTVGITLLTREQIGWLSTAQVQAVNYEQFPLLQPQQIPLLTAAQLSHPQFTGDAIKQWPDELQAALTRQQLQNLPLNVLSVYSHTEVEQTPPSTYQPAMQVPIVDGMPVTDHLTIEAKKFYALVPIQAATRVSAASGAWSSPGTWAGGVIPGAGDKVYVKPEHTVTFDAFMTTAINTLRIDGTLTFATDRNTQLKADTIVVYANADPNAGMPLGLGKLHIGTQAAPIGDNFTARILIADNGPLNPVADPNLLGRGLLSGGEVRMYGRVVTPFVELAGGVSAGATQVQLGQVPLAWRPGDRIVITGTNPTRDDFGADDVTIQAINGNTVTVTPLLFDHFAVPGMSLHVANISRNIQLVSENLAVPPSQRPHTIFFHNPNVKVSNIVVEGFGRTDKHFRINDPVVVNNVLQPGTGTNPRARYAIHFHHTSVNPTLPPAEIHGSVIIGSPGWGYVNHSSNVIMEDNIAYQIHGSGFIGEDGNEIGLMRHNLAINISGDPAFSAMFSRRDIHDFGFRGHGFWFQGPGIETVDNISAGTYDAGFIYYTSSNRTMFDAVNLDNPAMAGGRDAVPVGSVPIKGFRGNTAYTATIGLGVWFHQTFMTDGPSRIEDFTAWNLTQFGIELIYSGQVTVHNATLLGDLEDFKAPPEKTAPLTGVSTNWLAHDMRFENMHIEGFEIGIDVPVRRSTVIDSAYINAVQAIYIEKGHDTLRSVTISGATTLVTPTAAQLGGRTHYKVYLTLSGLPPEGSLQFIGRLMPSFFSQDMIRYAPSGAAPAMLLFLEQRGDYVPFASPSPSPKVPASYLDKSNEELWAQFGKAFAGGMPSPSASEVAGIRGYLMPAP